jgi:hypothetical protein
MFIPDPNFSIPDQKDSGSGSALNNLSKVLDILPIPDPGVKKAPDPGFGSVTLLSPILKIRGTPSFILSKKVCCSFFNR